MKFDASPELSSHEERLEIVQTVWADHPLRDADVDEALDLVMIQLHPSSNFGLEIIEYPLYSLGIPDSEERSDPDLLERLRKSCSRPIGQYHVVESWSSRSP